MHSSCDLPRLLQNVGFNAGEAAAYLACLKIGTQSVAAIAREAGLPPDEAVIILRRLHERGFLSRFASDQDFYTAEPPEAILGILESEQYETRKYIEELRGSLPAFKQLVNPALTKPELAFYSGEDGIIAAYEDTLTSKTDILAITSIDDTESAFPEYVPRYYLRRKAAGVLIKAIFPDTPMSRSRQAKDAQELRESRLVPRDLLADFRIEYYVYDDKVAYFSIPEGIAVIIKSSFIASSMRTVFSVIWRMTDRYDSKTS